MSTLSRGPKRGRTPTPTATSPARIAPPTTPQLPVDITQKVRERAFEIFLRRGGGPGDALSDWLQAERELGVGGRVGGGVPRISPAAEARSVMRGEVLLHSDE